MKQLFITAAAFMLAVTFVYAVDSTKPTYHTSDWEIKHGQAAKANDTECFTCHEERVECISCHEDTPPRNHTSSFVNRTHGIQARWNKTYCQTCHRQDYCDSCHENSFPLSHTRSGFVDISAAGFHCQTSCQLPTSNWNSTPAQNCIVCHKTRPVTTKSGIPHPQSDADMYK